LPIKALGLDKWADNKMAGIDLASYFANQNPQSSQPNMSVDPIMQAIQQGKLKMPAFPVPVMNRAPAMDMTAPAPVEAAPQSPYQGLTQTSTEEPVDPAVLKKLMSEYYSTLNPNVKANQASIQAQIDMAKAAPVQTDLSGLATMADYLNGPQSHLAAEYKAPPGAMDKAAVIAKLQEMSDNAVDKDAANAISFLKANLVNKTKTGIPMNQFTYNQMNGKQLPPAEINKLQTYKSGYDKAQEILNSVEQNKDSFSKLSALSSYIPGSKESVLAAQIAQLQPLASGINKGQAKGAKPLSLASGYQAIHDQAQQIADAYKNAHNGSVDTLGGSHYNVAGVSKIENENGGKISVSNGKETLMIDPADLVHAQADGYSAVK